MDIGWMLDGWLQKAELKPTQPSLAGAWLSLATLKPFHQRILSTILLLFDVMMLEACHKVNELVTNGVSWRSDVSRTHSAGPHIQAKLS